MKQSLMNLYELVVMNRIIVERLSVKYQQNHRSPFKIQDDRQYGHGHRNRTIYSILWHIKLIIVSQYPRAGSINSSAMF